MGEQLTDVEKQALAREVAADSFYADEDLLEYECEECGVHGDMEAVPVAVVREAVKHGWDARGEYEERQRGKT